jgi:hypothetical protein
VLEEPEERWRAAIANAQRTRNLIVIDDSKGANPLSNKLAALVAKAVPGCTIQTFTRESDPVFHVHHDRFSFDAAAVH